MLMDLQNCFHADTEHVGMFFVTLTLSWANVFSDMG